MGTLHWLILVPYYFFGAITLLGVFVLVARVLRLQLSINTLVTAAILLTVTGLTLPLAAGWLRISSFTGWGIAVLLVTSFAFAAIDTLLHRSLPLPLDEELAADD